MIYTTGKVREFIEKYQDLPNGCRLALKVLKQRFRQNTMIVEALKSSVISGPKISSTSGKLQNCCWAIIELQLNELDFTNKRQTFDRLPDPLQAK